MKFMKQLSFLIILAAMVLFIPLDSSAKGFCNGKELAWWMREYDNWERGAPNIDNSACGLYIGYVMAVYDAMIFVFNAPENVTTGQICSIAGKYLKENPEKWTLPAWVLVTEALQKAFPKR